MWPLSDFQHGSKVAVRFDMQVFFTNVGFVAFLVKYLALFGVLSVIESFKWFWMRSLCKNIQLLRVLLKASFLLLHFSYYTSMTFLMMLPVKLLSMLMIQLSTINVIRYAATTRVGSWTWIWPARHVDCGRKWLVNFNPAKTQPGLFSWSYNSGAVDVKIDRYFSEEK